jgi:hypothetical protein
MKLDLKIITQKIQPATTFAKKYTKFIFVILMLFIFTFLVFRINEFSRQEPTEDAVTEKLKTVQAPKLDKDIIQKINQLQDQNIQVQSLFDHARDNPFNE